MSVLRKTLNTVTVTVAAVTVTIQTLNSTAVEGLQLSQLQNESQSQFQPIIQDKEDIGINAWLALRNIRSLILLEKNRERVQFLKRQHERITNQKNERSRMRMLKEMEDITTQWKWQDLMRMKNECEDYALKLSQAEMQNLVTIGKELGSGWTAHAHISRVAAGPEEALRKRFPKLPQFGKEIVVKKYKKEVFESLIQSKMQIDELKAMRRISEVEVASDFTVEYYGSFFQGDILYIMLEAGKFDLQSYKPYSLQTSGIQHPSMDLITSCASMGTAMEFLHDKGITHGDQHAGNFMYFQGGKNGEGRWKLIDFGKAKFGHADKAEFDMDVEEDRAEVKQCFYDKHEECRQQRFPVRIR